MALGLPHVLKLWMGVSKGLLPIKYFAPTNPPFGVSQISLRSRGRHKDEVNMAALKFGKLPDLNQWCLSNTTIFWVYVEI